MNITRRGQNCRHDRNFCIRAAQRFALTRAAACCADRDRCEARNQHDPRKAHGAEKIRMSAAVRRILSTTPPVSLGLALAASILVFVRAQSSGPVAAYSFSEGTNTTT